MKKYTFQHGANIAIFDSVNGLAKLAPTILNEKYGPCFGFPDRTTITNRFRQNGNFRQTSFAFPVRVGSAEICCTISEADYYQTDIYADKKAAKRQLLINRKNAEQCKTK